MGGNGGTEIPRKKADIECLKEWRIKRIQLKGLVSPRNYGLKQDSK